MILTSIHIHLDKLKGFYKHSNAIYKRHSKKKKEEREIDIPFMSIAYGALTNYKVQLDLECTTVPAVPTFGTNATLKELYVVLDDKTSNTQKSIYMRVEFRIEKKKYSCEITILPEHCDFNLLATILSQLLIT